MKQGRPITRTLYNIMVLLNNQIKENAKLKIRTKTIKNVARLYFELSLIRCYSQVKTPDREART